MHAPLNGILVSCILSIFSIGAHAHDQIKVVVIPIGDAEPVEKTVFVTSTGYNGNLVQAANNLNKGNTYTDRLAAGDALCQSRADAGGNQLLL